MSRYRKAYWAALAAVCTTITLVWDGVSQQDALALVTAWGGVGGVFLFPNDPPEGEPADPGVSERGRVNAQLAVLVFIAVVVAAIAWHVLGVQINP